MIITKVIQRGVQHNTKVQYTRQPDGNILQAGHRMAASCFQCRGCGQRGHLAKDCPEMDESEDNPDSQEVVLEEITSVQATPQKAVQATSVHKTAHKTSKVEKQRLASEGTYRTVFCHCESLRSSLSPLLHLTQLAAVVDRGDTFFRAMVPPGELVSVPDMS